MTLMCVWFGVVGNPMGAFKSPAVEPRRDRVQTTVGLVRHQAIADGSSFQPRAPRFATPKGVKFSPVNKAVSTGILSGPTRCHRLVGSSPSFRGREQIVRTLPIKAQRRFSYFHSALCCSGELSPPGDRPSSRARASGKWCRSRS